VRAHSHHPPGPYPILILFGEQGAAKTNFLLDRNGVATSELPLNARDLFIAARNTRLLAFENVSKLSDAQSGDG
jgi:hypothetical protein